jgi:hypothetical protein
MNLLVSITTATGHPQRQAANASGVAAAGRQSPMPARQNS